MDEKKETTRVEAFSDGVFAIAITLLVLDLKPAVERGLASRPEEVSLFGAMWQQWPVFLAFLVSFATIGIMWLNHHRLFNLITRVNHTMLALNLLILFAVTVVPFPTALLGEYIDFPNEAAVLYSGVFLLVAIAYNLFWRYVSYRGRLLDQHVDMQMVKRIDRQYLFGPLMYAIAFALAWWQPLVSLGVEAALAVFFLLPGVELRRKKVRESPMNE